MEEARYRELPPGAEREEPFRKSPRLLNELQAIVAALDKHGRLNGFFFKEAWAPLRNVGKHLGISAQEAALFALALSASGNDPVSAGAIAQRINCNYIEFLKYMDSLENLEQKKLIQSVPVNPFDPKPKSLQPLYVIPAEVIKAVREGRAYKFEAYNNLQPAEFFKSAAHLFLLRRDEKLSGDSLAHEIRSLCAANTGIAFVKNLPAESLAGGDICLLLFAACGAVISGRDIFHVRQLPRYFGGPQARRFAGQLARGESSLLKTGLLEAGKDSGSGDRELFSLTKKAKTALLSDVDLKKRKNPKGKELIESASIEEKPLFYPEKVRARIDELAAVFARENLERIQRRLRETGMPSGFTCLFSGAPGTGKTETAFQLARLSGRDIFRVDVSQAKSKWFGESEKLVKDIFVRYRSILRSGGPAPILLFNEADAVLGKRRQLGDERNGCGQTENAMQNIILEEMENFSDGILIATTNMKTNFDQAFERRFLYKIEFEKPDAAVRAAIWRCFLPDLTERQAGLLAGRYDLSGAQIRNVAKKHAVYSILHERGGRTPRCLRPARPAPRLDKIAAYCDEENPEKEKKPIGFCV